MWSALAALFMPMGLLNGTTTGHTWRVIETVQADGAGIPFDVVAQQRYQHLVEDLADRARSGDGAKDLVAVAMDLGLELVIDDQRFELRPATRATQGAGVLALHRGQLSSEVVLTAPHPFDDRDSGWVAAEVFDQGAIRALYIATGAAQAQDGRSTGDARDHALASQADPRADEESSLRLATRALDLALDDPWVVQIHTFDMRVAEPAIVVDSAGAATPRAELEHAADKLCLALNGVDVRTSRYTLRLASQDNPQLEALGGSDRFLLLGFSSGYSARVASDPDHAAAIGHVLVELARPDRKPAAWPPPLS